MKRRRGTLVLLGVFVALCAGYWLMVRLEARHKQHVELTKRVFSVAEKDIASVEVHRIDETPVLGERKGEAWAIVKPNPTIEPNQVVWDRLVKATAELSNHRTIDPAGKGLPQYGLDKPVLTIAAQITGKTALNLTFGALEPTQKFRYALVKGGNLDGAVFLVDAKSFNELDRPLSLLRYPYVVNVGKEGIHRIEMSRFWTKLAQNNSAPTHKIGEESEVVAAERDTTGQWKLVAPVPAAANQEMVEGLVKAVQYATGRDYIDEPKNLSDYGLDPPRARITVFSDKNIAQTLYIGSLEHAGSKDNPGSVYVKRKELPTVFVMDADVLAKLPETPDSFRESRLFSGTATDLETIHYVAGTTDITFQNDPKLGWRIVQPAVDDTDQVAVSAFLTLLKVLKGSHFPGPAQPQFGLDNPVVLITLTSQKGGKPVQIKLGAKVPETGQYYAMQDNGVVTTVGSLEASSLTKSLYDFRQMSFLGFNAAEASKVALDLDGKHYAFERPRGQWLIVEPEGQAFGSPKDIEPLLKTLSSLRIAAVETETDQADPAQYGLDAPTAVITVTALAQNNSAPAQARNNSAPTGQMILGPLKIGKPTPDNSQLRFATTPKFHGVYRVRQAVVDDIRETVKNIHPK